MTHNHQASPRWLDPQNPVIEFPDVERAMQDPDGLLAVGGALSTEWLLHAYRRGIFPWYGPGQPILWWAPDPRLVLYPERLHVSRSLARVIRKGIYTVTLDTAFNEVVAACASPRPGQSGTWITPEMHEAYVRFHHEGYAHSAECWHEGQLVGGLYGVAIGGIFFGESMFARATDASKVAFVALVRQLARWGFRLIDCQVHTDHLASLGAVAIPRRVFTAILERECHTPGAVRHWMLDEDILFLSP
ncbi:MAG: leucyl/phenylalanyl-tRNA--protein transferase [Gammaproteobacteria bacterium]|jgi:leucyl/phenylalanyl-tRNA--protein transferase